MKQRRDVLWFLATTVAISWPLFLLPLAFPGLKLTAFALAMFAPGTAAVLVTRFVAGESLRTLNLQRLGPKRYYLWAWLLPPALSAVALLFTVLLGTGQLDTTFAAIRSALPAQEGGPAIPVAAVVAGQVILALTIAPLINTIPAMGEELGWRGFLLPRLLPMGRLRAIVLSGLVWGVWHAPAILQGHNYPDDPVLGVFLMIVLCVLLGTILSWLYLSTRSPWAPALAHGAFNAAAGLPMLFLQPGISLTWGGTLASVSGWIGVALFVGWLVASRRLVLSRESAS